MDYVEKLVTSKIKEMILKFNDKDKMIDITKQKLKEEKNKNKYVLELEECQNKISKIDLEIDNIYNDKLSGVLLQDDFERIYERKKQEKCNFQKRIEKIKNHIDNNIENDDEMIKKLMKKFDEEVIINRESFASLIDRIEIDENKKVYVYFKFKGLVS